MLSRGGGRALGFGEEQLLLGMIQTDVKASLGTSRENRML